MTPSPPLCVDLDGTLVATDTMLEGLLLLLKANPLYFFVIFWWWLRRGRAYLKRQIASRVSFNPRDWPYRPEVLDFLRQEHARGRDLVLATGSDEKIAQDVARHLGLFSLVLASDGEINLTSHRKQKALSERFGSHNFDYAGDSFKDMPVWLDCRRAYLVDVSPKIIKELERKAVACEIILPRKPGLFKNLIRSIRVHQWSKNLLLFVPMVTAHKLTDWQTWQASLLAFICFCLCASGVYMQNDLMDLQADRRHLSKRKRPLAKGDLPLALGVILAPLLTLSGLGLAFCLPEDFLYLLLTYLLITLAYSFKLKAKVILDILILAGLYTLRLLAGGAATGVPISPWLMGFSIFIFLSLAFCKRFVEIYRLQGQEEQWVVGRGYHLSDQNLLLCGGMVSGYLSVLVFALYLNSPTVAALYHHPQWLWLICPFFIYWISRVWLWAHRGKMVEDPIFFLFRDRVSYMVGLIVAAILYLAA